jgi:hypothetical protein
MTDEWRASMSRAKKGVKLGRERKMPPVTDEHRENLRDAQLRRWEKWRAERGL